MAMIFLKSGGRLISYLININCEFNKLTEIPVCYKHARKIKIKAVWITLKFITKIHVIWQRNLLQLTMIIIDEV